MRLIGPNGEQIGIVSTIDALKRAEEAGMDLVEVAVEAVPPVCKIVNYTKILYDQKRKARDAKKKQKSLSMKEIKLRPRTDKHDLEFKLKHAEKFLSEGHKVKITMFFRGREITHKEIGKELFESAIEALKTVADTEPQNVRDEKMFSMVMVPKAHK